MVFRFLNWTDVGQILDNQSDMIDLLIKNKVDWNDVVIENDGSIRATVGTKIERRKEEPKEE